jgi:HEAT repeat protein
MKKWACMNLGIGLLLAGLAIALLIPTSRLVLGGVFQNEPTYRGKPTRYWTHVLIEPDSFEEIVEILKQDPPRAAPALIPALGDPDPETRLKVGQALGALGQPAVRALCEALSDPNPLVRITVARALQRIGPEAREAIPALTQALRDDDPLVVRMVVTALERTGKEAVPVLHDALREHKEVAIRKAIVMALGQLGPAASETVPTLLAIFKDDNDPVQDVAGEALRRVDPAVADKVGVP